MSELYVESPLAHREAPQGLSIELREITDRGMIDVRGLRQRQEIHGGGKKSSGPRSAEGAAHAACPGAM